MLKGGERDGSGKASTGPPLSATDNKLGCKREEKGCLWEGAPVGSCFCHLLLPSFICQQRSLSPWIWKTEGFFPAVPLSGDNHLLVGAPHRQSEPASTRAVQKQTQTSIYSISLYKMLPWVAVVIFQNTLKGIYQLSLTSRATITVVQRLALKYPGPEPAVSQPSPASESIILFNPGSRGCKSSH